MTRAITHPEFTPAEGCSALLIVDVQRDFCEGGALGVAGGTEVAQRIAQFLAQESHRYELIVASRDWHDAQSTNGGHFAKAGQDPDYQTTWPVHCVANTPGAQFQLSEIADAAQWQVYKGMGQAAYSAFEGVAVPAGECFTPRSAASHTLTELLHSRKVHTVDIVGIATDYCVCASARDAKAAGFAVRVLTHYTAGVAPATTQAALSQLNDAGVQVLSDADLPH